jgi:excisionase family DNA binding protein
MLKNQMLDDARQSFLGFLDAFKSDLIGEVKGTIQNEISLTGAHEKKLDQTLSRREAAALLDCSLTTLCQYQKQGTIPYYKVGKKVLFKREELLEAIRKQVKKGGRHE